MEVQFMENKISGRGVTDADKNRVQLDAERESVTRLKHQLELKNEEANKMLDQLKQEEELAKKELEDGI